MDWEGGGLMNEHGVGCCLHWRKLSVGYGIGMV
jgi:hypothetical protein